MSIFKDKEMLFYIYRALCIFKKKFPLLARYVPNVAKRSIMTLRYITLHKSIIYNIKKYKRLLQYAVIRYCIVHNIFSNFQILKQIVWGDFWVASTPFVSSADCREIF